MTDEERETIKAALAHYAAAREVPGWAKVLADAARAYLNLDLAIDMWDHR